MSLSEFNLIERYFTARGVRRDDVVLGVGDDCALLRVPSGMELAVSIDALVEGRHYPLGTEPAAVGHKALAVGLSDLAAMGAEPAWATLALSLPEADEAWLEGFAEGLFVLARRFHVQLVGGDTVRGPRVISLQLHGFVPQGQALRRDGARAGDLIYVTGTPGDAGLGLELALGQRRTAAAHADYLRARLDRPEPRVAAGLQLREIASAAIDISDGLVADLGHILERSGVGARLELAHLPCSSAMQHVLPEAAERWRYALASGDDYELCFTVPPARREAAEQVCATLDCSCHCIGRIEAEAGLRLMQADGTLLHGVPRGFDHFG
ncbi:MAG: thiamine-phosphate kinase [Thiohalomonadaceae bacterium]